MASRLISVVLPPSFFAGSVAGTLDLFFAANRLNGSTSKPLFKWQLLSEDGLPVSSSTGLRLDVAGDYARAGRSDVVIIPGIVYEDLPRYERRLAAQRGLIDHLPRWHQRGCLIAANCTGVSVLAESGLLDDHEATISWWLSAWFRQRYPAVHLQTHAVITESNSLMCSGATTSYLNLALRLVEHFAGPDLAMQCARMMLVDVNRASQAPYSTMQQYSGHNDALVIKCQQWLHDHLTLPFSLDLMAKSVGASERTLMRRFKLALGDTPLHYMQQMRLHLARRMLETSHQGIEQIVADVGYSDVSTFRRLFKREMQCSPAEYRRRFAAG